MSLAWEVPVMTKYLLLGYAVVSLLCLVILYVEDIDKSFHMPSRELFMLSAMGGSAGTLLGMFFFHRKWRRALFRIGVPLLVVVQVLLLMLV